MPSTSFVGSLVAAIAITTLPVLFNSSKDAHAAELKVVSATGVKAVVSELAVHFERNTGHQLTMHFDGNADWRRKINDGETFDVAVFNPVLIDELVQHGKIVSRIRELTSRAPA